MDVAVGTHRIPAVARAIRRLWLAEHRVIIHGCLCEDWVRLRRRVDVLRVRVDLEVGGWLLQTKLVAGEAHDLKSLGMKPLMNLRQLRIVERRYASVGGHINHKDNVVTVLVKLLEVPVDVDGGQVEELANAQRRVR